MKGVYFSKNIHDLETKLKEKKRKEKKMNLTVTPDIIPE